jgi:hypothetical protein
MTTTTRTFYVVETGGSFADITENTLKEALTTLHNFGECPDGTEANKAFWRKQRAQCKLMKVTEISEEINLSELEPAEFPGGEFPNWYEVKHNMTEEFIEAHRTDETPGTYEPDDEMFCSEHQREKHLVDYEDGSRYECPECERERGEELGLI